MQGRKCIYVPCPQCAFAGDSSDDFVIIIPPCFDPHAPLAALEMQQGGADIEDSLVPLEWEILPSPTGPQVQMDTPISNEDTPITNEDTPTRVSPSASPKATRGGALNNSRRTLRDANLLEPLSVATGLVNSVANFVKDMHFGRLQNGQFAVADLALEELQPTEENDLSRKQANEDDEEVEDLQVCVRVCVCVHPCVCK